jgi:hypothetical protein
MPRESIYRRGFGVECPCCGHRFFARPPTLDVLYSKIDFNGPIPLHRPWLGPCEQWRGKTNKFGRGVATYQGQEWYVYRLSYLLRVGPIPAGLWVLHDCDNPLCVRPDHLFLGRQRHNQQDMIAKGRQRWNQKGGYRHHRAISRDLTERIEEALREPGVAQNAVAKRLGVSWHTVHRIRTETRFRPH